jgi:hypothetical protein
VDQVGQWDQEDLWVDQEDQWDREDLWAGLVDP